ncbi:MAG: Ig-like domain repeat protein, partial [Planctomycetaceae bacterium]
MFHHSERWFARAFAPKRHDRSLRANRRRPVLESLEERTLLSPISLMLDDSGTKFPPAPGVEDPVVYAVNPDGTLSTTPFGFEASSFNLQQGPTFPEQFDLHGEYTSTLGAGSPGGLLPGQSVVVNFNFAGEPEVGSAQAGFIGDTLNLVFTGHTPTAADPTNISVDLHFRSDVNETTPLTPVSGGTVFTVPETIGFIPLNTMIATAMSANGVTATPDFSLSVQSAAKINTSTATVIQDATNTPITAPVASGATVHDTATVTGTPGLTPTGTVTYEFFTTLDGTGPHTDQVVTLNPDGTVPNSTATAALAVGSYSFIAVYSGDSNYNSSTSPIEPLVVSILPPTTTVTVIQDATNTPITGPVALGTT